MLRSSTRRCGSVSFRCRRAYRVSSGSSRAAKETTSTVEGSTQSFLMRVANRIFTSRELSQPEVLAYLLGYETDFSNIHSWTWVHLNSLYWACAKEWPALREALGNLGQEPQPDNLYFQVEGLKLPYIEAYKNRGPVLRNLCFYEYLSSVVLKRKQSRWRGTTPFLSRRR